jgi:RNA polymerase sigma-70 factor (sigma-E family)
MARDRDGAELEQLLAERGSALLAVATALAGNRQDGEDLLQAALERVLRKPRRLSHDSDGDGDGKSDVEGYLRRVLYNLAADGWRRRGTWKQKLLPVLRAESVTTAEPDPATEVDRRDELVRLLGQLPPRQRAVIVLRYWEQCSETETAALLGCSEGTVKSAASRGLAHLRELAAPDDATELTEKNS